MIDVAYAAKIIKIPVSKWPGNCSAIVQAFLDNKLVNGRYQYGHYLGYISPKSSLFGGRPFAHHAWIRSMDDVIDPTRWVFENVKPYVHFGPLTDDYDLGGNRLLRVIFKRPIPEFNPDERTLSLATMPAACRKLVKGLVKRRSNTISFGQIIWLANIDPNTFGPETKTLYQWLIDNKLSGTIPMDNRREVMGEY